MILQALSGYYDRLRAEPEPEVPAYGFSVQGVHFCLVLDRHGVLAGDPEDLREEGHPRSLVVPQGVKRSVDIAPNYLWDNTGYVLGADAKGKPERAMATFEAFKAHQRAVAGDLDDEGVRAVLAFLDAWDPARAQELPLWEEMAGANVVFRFDGEQEFIHDRPALRGAWLEHLETAAQGETGICLVTGREEAISRLHASVKGIPEAQTSGAALVSFNQPSFTSYGKEQSFNAPVSEQASFGYTTALNHLLRQRGRRVQVGDTTVVFWTEKSTTAESYLPALIAGWDAPQDVEDKAVARDLGLFLDAVKQGRAPTDIQDAGTAFYVLGLAPNAARLAVRFWHVGTVGEMAERVARHFRDLAVVKQYDNQPDHPGVWHLARELAAQGDMKNFPAILAGGLLRAVVTGGRYPDSWIGAVLGRIRADKTVSYLRAAMLRACLIRNHNKEIPMALDTARTDAPYLLGRLFAVLERAQQEAVPGANATIRDRFIGAASATPARVFPVLLKGADNHLAKLRKLKEKEGTSHWLDRQVQDICAEIADFPLTLPTPEQGVFQLGYYHQRKDFFTKKDEKEN